MSAPTDGGVFNQEQFAKDQAGIERKIDNAQFDPISHKKTLTLVNYFILNTSQFLNSFANVTEEKIHSIDENIDQLETIISIFESKLDSLPEELFENVAEDAPQAAEQIVGEGAYLSSATPVVPAETKMANLAPTENPLMAAGPKPKLQVQV